MQQELTYMQLHQLHLDIEKQAAASPAFQFFNGQKIKSFLQRNRLRLNAISDMRSSAIKKYVQRNEEGEFLTKDMEDGTKEYVFENEENREAYLKEIEAFMSRSVMVEY